MWSDELETIQLTELVEAYTVRQVWLAQLQAATLLKLLSQALGHGGEQEMVAPGEMLAMMGVELPEMAPAE